MARTRLDGAGSRQPALSRGQGWRSDRAVLSAGRAHLLRFQGAGLMSGAGGPICRAMPRAVGLPLDRSKESSVAPPATTRSAKQRYGPSCGIDCRRKTNGRARGVQWCDGNLPFASRLMAVLSTAGHWTGQVLSNAEFHFPPVAQTVGFGPGRSKMLDLSMGID
jgi:hypothetical protein